jgi:tetratricopeptide (TPR) repeat protein
MSSVKFQVLDISHLLTGHLPRCKSITIGERLDAHLSVGGMKTIECAIRTLSIQLRDRRDALLSGGKVAIQTLRAHVLGLVLVSTLFGFSERDAQLAACKGPRELEQAIAQNGSARSYNALGAYFARQRQLPCAISAFEAAVRSNVISWESHYNLGLALRETGQMSEAARELRQAVAQKPALENIRIALGTVLSELGELEASADEYREALKSNPQSIDALYNLARVLGQEKNYGAAISYLRRGLTVKPNDAAMGLALGIALAQNGNPEEAKHLLENVASGHPEAAQVHYNLASLYAQQNLYRDAATEYAKALAIDPEDDSARLSEAKALVTLAEYEAARPLAQAYVARKPKDYDGYYLVGLIAKEEGHNAEAEANLRKAFQLNPPGNYQLHYELGVILEKAGKLDEAKAHLEEAARLDPDANGPPYHLAKILQALKDADRASGQLQSLERTFDERRKKERAEVLSLKAAQLLTQGDAHGAAEAYKECLQLLPRDAKLYYGLSLALNKLADRGAEQRALQKAVELNPAFALAHNQLGLLELDQGRSEQAEKEFRIAAKSDPRLAEAKNNLAVLYGRQGKNEEAEQLLRDAIKSNPEYAQAFVNLGLTLAEEGKTTEALDQIMDGLRIDPNAVAGLNALGMLQARLGQMRNSAEAFRKVVKLAPKSPEAHLNLGMALVNEFDIEGALKEFAYATDLAPDLASAHYYKGRTLFDLTRYGEATGELERAVDLAHDMASAFYLLGLIKIQTHHDNDPSEFLEKVIALEPGNAVVWYLAGQNLLDRGKTSQGLVYWEKAVELDPDYTEALYNLSRALTRRGSPLARNYQERLKDLERRLRILDDVARLQNFAAASANARNWPRAIEQLRDALKICRNCSLEADLHRDIGLVYSRSGDSREGAEELRLALKLKPDENDALPALKSVELLSRRLR